jgi:hypothetical protein
MSDHGTDDVPTYEENPESYLRLLREEMAREPWLTRTPDGTVLYGWRCWPNYGERAVVDAMLDGLERHAGSGFEIYAILVDREAEAGDLDAWSEAWRVSDRVRVRMGPMGEIACALVEARMPRWRG